jgi:PTH1 family peptidyl-tRNA hydrolase
VGIGQPPEGWDAANYVLGKFGKGELAEVELMIERAADAVVDWARDGIGACMNRYNA